MQIQRILNLSLLSVVSSYGCYGNNSNKPKFDAPPNVVVILSDDQGWGDLSINGNSNLETPNIDKLAQKGTQFNHFYVCPVCSPTRAEFLTGRYHPRCGVSGVSEGAERMNLDETTIATIFKNAGYATAAFGKWHNGMQYPYNPNGRGFDEFYGFCSGHWGDYFSPPLEHNGKPVQGNGYIINDLTEKAMEFMESNKEKPFFLYVPFNSPHSPMQVPDQWWTRFKDKEIKMLSDNRGKEDINFTRAALAMCENVDWNVGRIISKLKALHLEENTIVVYFSDNGPNSRRWNGGMKGTKGTTDEGGVRSPLIIKWKGKIASGRKIDEISGAIDLLPTLADLAGINFRAPKPLDGISLKPLLLKTAKEWPDRFIYSTWSDKISVRSQKYRLDNQGNLFDMVADPGQFKNISAEQPAVTMQLKRAAEKWKNDLFSGIQPATRPFPVGHPDFGYTQLPARDGKAHGRIKRSSIPPNSSFFTNWTDPEDKITWNVEVLSEGDYKVEVYYTCPSKDTGSTIKLSFGSDKLEARITEANDPPLRGMENDRIERKESYVKDFKPLKMGVIHLMKGSGELTLQSENISGSQVMDLRMITLTSQN